jgi:hypothetical protein
MTVNRFLESQLPQPFQRLQNPLDLLGAFLVLPAEEARQGLGVMRSGDIPVAGADELAEDGDLL